MGNQKGPAVQHRELCSVLCGSLDEKGVWGRMDTCICMAKSLCCPPETITTLLIGYMPISRRLWHPTPVLLPGKSHGRRSLMGCSPWGREELDMTEQLHRHFSLSCIGEGNSNPLQCSCLENPRDWGSLVGCHLWGCTELDTTEVTQQQQQQQHGFAECSRISSKSM